MAWAVFHRECNWKVPGRNATLQVMPSPQPRAVPRGMADYAVAMGYATEIPPPAKGQAPVVNGVNRRARKAGKPKP